MESSQEINFLTKPKINIEKLKYIQNDPINIYVNLYEIILSKELKLFQYPFSISPEPDENNEKLMKLLYKGCYGHLKSIFKNFFINNKILYSPTKVDQIKTVKSLVYMGGREEYNLEFSKFKNEKIIKAEDVNKDSLAKQYLELILNVCLHANTKLDFFKDIFVMNNEKVTINVSGVAVDFYPGFITSFVETEKGNFLNVNLKNKIIQQKTILDFLIENDYKNRNKKDEIKEKLKNSIFKDTYKGKNYKIFDIDFDLNPLNKVCQYKGQTLKIIDYYREKYDIEIENKEQPLIIVCKGPPELDKSKLYFVPELCTLVGLEEYQIKNPKFMSELSVGKTKLFPNERVEKTNEFIKVIKDKDKKENKMSPKEILDYYGLKIKPVKEGFFTGYYMKTPGLYDYENKKIEKNVFPVIKNKNLKKKQWYCVYEKGEKNYKNADKFYNALCDASKGFEITVEEPQWIEVPYNSSGKTWINYVEKYSNNINENTLVVFLVNDEFIYAAIKKHSLCKSGYISQVVKNSTINRKGLISICSKILLQINSKLGGISYTIKFDKKIYNMKIMVVGIDSSHIKGKRTGIGMVSTLDENFCNFYNKEKIIEEKNKKELNFCVADFIKEAIRAYKYENDEEPKNIVIYRQGVSLQQKEKLKEEIKEIDTVCQNKNISYYYIFVNTKSNYKIFHIENGKYYNPYSGLLVLDGITNRNFFEFYLQPQEVNEGSSTPTCFHVAYGDLKFHDLIPKFTYDLCHLYSNWKGPVRMPNVIKAAEKLSKMAAKYTLGELNPKLKYGQSYL